MEGHAPAGLKHTASRLPCSEHDEHDAGIKPGLQPHRQERRKASSMNARFWEKVEKTETCWNWTGPTTDFGYGQILLTTGKRTGVHRYAYEQLVGKIPSGLVIDHLCRNKICVNPEHLEVVTHRVNILRGVGVPALNASKTHCCRGHRLAGENLYIKPDSERRCRACDKLRRKPKPPRGAGR